MSSTVETSLHRELKRKYGPGTGGRAEVAIGGYRIDAVDGEGNLIEVQSGPLGPLRGKLSVLLPHYRIRVIKPLWIRRRVIKRNKRDLKELSSRLSPKRRELFDVFEDLVGVASIFPHANLTIDVVPMTIEEIRVPRRRWPGYEVADRRLGDIESAVPLSVAHDLWKLLPQTWDWALPFTTKDLARRLGRPLHIVQRIAYCLRHAGAVDLAGKEGNRLVYVRSQLRAEKQTRLLIG